MRAYEGGKALGGGIQGATLSDMGLLQELQSYRRRVASTYRALRPEEIDSLPHGPMLVSPKIDGELWFFCSTQDEQFLANSRGRVIAGDIPLLTDAPRLPAGSIVAGELSVLVEARRARVGDLASLLEARQPDLSKLRFAAFDLVRDPAQPSALPYASRLERLRDLIAASPFVEVVPTEALESPIELKKRYERDVASGALEGLIIRQQTGPTLKLKPSITLDAAIIGYTTRIERPN
jgi:ATP-dependent DNA ligase